MTPRRVTFHDDHRAAYIFVERRHVTAKVKGPPPIVIRPEGAPRDDARHFESVEIDGPSRVLYDPEGFTHGPERIRVWIECRLADLICWESDDQ